MKYYSAIISLFTLSIFAIISLLYLGNITRKIQKENNILINNIHFIKDQININEIEYSLYNSYEYLQKMQKIYLKESNDEIISNRVSFKSLKNKNLENFYTVGIE